MTVRLLEIECYRCPWVLEELPCASLADSVTRDKLDILKVSTVQPRLRCAACQASPGQVGGTYSNQTLHSKEVHESLREWTSFWHENRMARGSGLFLKLYSSFRRNSTRFTFFLVCAVQGCRLDCDTSIGRFGLPDQDQQLCIGGAGFYASKPPRSSCRKTMCQSRGGVH